MHYSRIHEIYGTSLETHKRWTKNRRLTIAAVKNVTQSRKRLLNQRLIGRRLEVQNLAIASCNSFELKCFCACFYVVNLANS